MTKAGATLWNRKGSQDDQNALIGALVILVNKAGGKVTISSEEWLEGKASIGLRARYNPDGSFTLWTYDVVEDMKRIAGVE